MLVLVLVGWVPLRAEERLMRSGTSVEHRIDALAHRFLGSVQADGVSDRRPRAKLTEFVVVGLKQGWACIFGAALLAVLFAARLCYPEVQPWPGTTS